MASMDDVMKFLAPFAAILKPELLSLEAQGKAELDKIIEGVSSPDLKLLLQSLAGALDGFAKVEIDKIG